MNIIQKNAGEDARREFGELGALHVLRSSDTEARCSVCLRRYDMTDNDGKTCYSHHDLSGKRGVFKRTALESSITDVTEDGEGSWSCCGATGKRHPGCKNNGNHQMRKIMFSLSMDSNPSVKIDDLDLGIINALSISLFPEDKDEVKVQIANSIYSMLHRYFNINESLEKEIMSENEEISRKESRSFLLKKFRKQGNKSEKKTPSHTSRIRYDAQALQKEAALRPKNQEAIYIKYMRVGEIVVDVSTAGFFVNLKEYKASIDAFVLHGKVYDWQRLLLKVEKQAAGSVARHTISDWGGKFLKVVSKAFYGKHRNQVSEEDWGSDKEVLVFLYRLRAFL